MKTCRSFENIFTTNHPGFARGSAEASTDGTDTLGLLTVRISVIRGKNVFCSDMDIKSLLTQLTQRKASLPIQFIKYSLSGGVAVAVHIFFFYLLAWLIVPALKEDDIVVRILNLSVTAINDTVRARNAVINNWLAFIFSNLAAYVLNVLWVFESGRHNRWVEIIMFYAVSAISIAVGSVVMGLLIKYLGSSTTLAFGADIVAAAAVNFVVRKYYIFKG